MCLFRSDRYQASHSCDCHGIAPPVVVRLVQNSYREKLSKIDFQFDLVPNAIIVSIPVIEGHYYVTLYTYDPSISSPNDDAEDVELDFVEGDIIVVCIRVFVYYSLSLSLFVQARGDLDEDGFFEGDLYGRVWTGTVQYGGAHH